MRSTRILAAFAARADGGVAIIFAASLLSLCLAAGLALDYARAYSIQSELRNDLDIAVLGAASKMTTPSELQSVAEKFFDGNWKAKHGVSSVSVSVTKTADNRVSGIVSATVPTTLMKLAGFATIDLHAVAEVEVAGGDVELSMVLDTTASMD